MPQLSRRAFIATGLGAFGRLATRLDKSGRSLAEIRAAIDKKFQ